VFCFPWYKTLMEKIFIWKSFFNYHTSVESKTCSIPKHVFITDLLEELYKYIDVVVHFTRKNHWEIFYPPHPMIRRMAICFYDTKVDEVRALVLVTHSYLTRTNFSHVYVRGLHNKNDGRKLSRTKETYRL